MDKTPGIFTLCLKNFGPDLFRAGAGPPGRFLAGCFPQERVIVIIRRTLKIGAREEGEPVNFLRVGDKVLDPERIHRTVDLILKLRQEGLSQQEVAERLGVDRTLVSRLEGLGEVRKGPRLAVVGFPVANGAELAEAARTEGVDFVLLMSEEERWRYVKEKSGAELINEFMALVFQLESYDAVIFLGSDMRIKMVEAILGSRLVGWEIGASPIKEDRWVNPEQLRRLIRQLRKA